MTTQKLYETDSHLAQFDAKVLSCEKYGENYAVILDKTAFFPEGGGQKADTGYIEGARVTDVINSAEKIVHICDSNIKSKTVQCKIDWELRFSRMQNHSGEHVFSGIVHSMTGFDNVGFHMGEDFMTIDFSGELSNDQLVKAELMSNEAVYANLPVYSYYPTEHELKNLDYRSKLNLLSGVRITVIEGVDMCACCAPHVRSTGEIGIVKVLSYMRHRRGTRVFLVCGKQAFLDYANKNNQAQKIGDLLCVKKTEVYEAVKKQSDDYAASRIENSNLKKKFASIIAKNVQKTEGNIYVFEEGLSIDELRTIVNGCHEKTQNIAAAFSGSDNTCYNYVIHSKSFDTSKLSREINKNLNGKGGGKNGMLQGSLHAKKEQIISFFDQTIAMLPIK